MPTALLKRRRVDATDVGDGANDSESSMGAYDSASQSPSESDYESLSESSSEEEQNSTVARRGASTLPSRSVSSHRSSAMSMGSVGSSASKLVAVSAPAASVARSGVKASSSASAAATVVSGARSAVKVSAPAAAASLVAGSRSRSAVGAAPSTARSAVQASTSKLGTPGVYAASSAAAPSATAASASAAAAAAAAPSTTAASAAAAPAAPAAPAAHSVVEESGKKRTLSHAAPHQPSESEEMVGCKFAKLGRFEIVSIIGKGAFGEIFECVDHYRGRTVAAKMEKWNAEPPQLEIEYNMYRHLRGCVGVPELFWFSRNEIVCGKRKNVLIISKLGKSLEEVMQSRPDKKMRMADVLRIGEKATRVLASIHSKGIVHRDIKPENFLLGPDNDVSGPLYLVDYGLSKRIIREGKHVERKTGKDMTGTPRYASVNNHLGIEQSRGDDLTSLMFSLVYLAKGNLPWQGKRISDPQKRYREVMRDKMRAMSSGDLFSDMPSVFLKLRDTINSIMFAQEPPYDHIASMLANAADGLESE